MDKGIKESPDSFPVTWHPISLEDHEHPIDQVKRLKVIVVGAGITGINAAILLPAKVPNIDLSVFEREPDIGGIWNSCVYPGVRCDVPSHVYQSTFAPSQEWSEPYAQGAEIKAYWSKVAARHDAYRYIRFRHEVLSAVWNCDKAKWLVTVRKTTVENSTSTAITTTTISTEETDFLVLATGIFSHPKMPQYPGMDEYKGRLFHSSRWDTSFDPTGRRIAIIGNGSSGMQILPPLQRIATHIDHYARSPAWVAGVNFGADVNTTDNAPVRDGSSFSSHPSRPADLLPQNYLKYRKRLESRSFTGFGSVVRGGAASKNARERYTAIMQERLAGRPDLMVSLIPKFSPSCRRLTPGPGYLEALVQSNVDFVATSVECFTQAGIRTVDGVERAVDAVICCTGSESSLAPPFSVVAECGSGAQPVDLSTAWKPGGSIGYPETYMGVAAPGFPNLLFVNGPQCASATGTLPWATENQLTLVSRILRKASSHGIRTMMPSAQAAADFQAYCEAYFPRTVLSENCRSWFNGGISGGRVIASWPGSGLHANRARREPRWEDWEYTYEGPSGNRFAYFGNGWTKRDIQVNQDGPPPQDVDLTPYLQLDSVIGQVDLRGYHENWYDA